MIQDSTRNQLQNVTNRFQGNSKKVLCVCSAGILRSPTVAVVLNKEFGYNTRSAGIGDQALIPLSTALLSWADEIICVEPYIYNTLIHELKFINLSDIELEDFEKKIKVLSIPDRYDYMNEKLQVLILEQYKNLNNEVIEEK